MTLPEGFLDKRLVKPISFPGIRETFKLKDINLSTQGVNLLCIVLLLWFAERAERRVLWSVTISNSAP